MGWAGITPKDRRGSSRTELNAAQHVGLITCQYLIVRTALWNSTKLITPSTFAKKMMNPISNTRLRSWNKLSVKAFFSNPIEEPIVQKALQEPVAFMGGMFAGLLRLDMNDDPLKEWVTRTVEASGITVEEADTEGSNPEEETPQQIEIE